MGTILKNGINYSGSGSGSGGVSSYNELTDKPSIEGITLSGNKTASDLGLAKSTDIPSTDTCYSTSDTAETTIADDDYFPFYDTSASGKRKTLWSNIKSVLKTYFDTYYSGGSSITAGTGLELSNDEMSIKEFESGDMTEVMTPLPSSASKYMNYSTEEQVVGQWIDGQTIYQKTLNLTSKTVTTGRNEITLTSYIGSNISNVWVDSTMSTMSEGGLLITASLGGWGDANLAWSNYKAGSLFAFIYNSVPFLIYQKSASIGTTHWGYVTLRYTKS